MNRNRCCIECRITKDGIQYEAGTSLMCRCQNGIVEVFVKYDFSQEPLRLCAAAQYGDCVRLCVLPYRLELYVNDRLVDEEWPCGKHRLCETPIVERDCDLRVQEFAESDEQQPNVLGMFENAQGWKPQESVFVGDCMPYSHDGAYHVLYLKDRHHHRSKWGMGAHQWEHISTTDFVHWYIHPMAVAIDDPMEGSICTGSWICDSNRQYLFYTVRMADGSPAKICRSISEDGYHFRKDRSFSFTLSDTYVATAARDPKIIKDENGRFHMLLTTSLTDSKIGCLAHLVSDDLQTWRELDKPLLLSPKGMGEPECPDYFFKDGFYYLVYSLQGKGYYQYSDQPFGNWRQPADPIIPCKSVPKAAVWNDRLIFTGFDGNGQYAGTMTFLEAVVKQDGQLMYIP